MTPLGKADWIYDHELDIHLPSCSQVTFTGLRCRQGPLVGEQIETGDCGADHGTDLVEPKIDPQGDPLLDALGTGRLNNGA